MKMLNMFLFAVLLVTSVTSSAQRRKDATEIDEAEVAAARESMLRDVTPERCLRLSRIGHTEVIDDSTIVFEVGRDLYINQLRRECPNLERSGRFMYEVRTGQLCSSDLITVLDRFGTSYMRGFTCALSEFYPITEADVALLKGELEGGGRGGSAVEVTPVELPEEPEVEAQADSAE